MPSDFRVGRMWFHPAESARKKANAKKAAEAYRANGYRARVEKTGATYYVFVSETKRKRRKR